MKERIILRKKESKKFIMNDRKNERNKFVKKERKKERKDKG